MAPPDFHPGLPSLSPHLTLVSEVIGILWNWFQNGSTKKTWHSSFWSLAFVLALLLLPHNSIPCLYVQLGTARVSTYSSSQYHFWYCWGCWSFKKKKNKQKTAFGFNIFPLLSIFFISDFCSYLYFYIPSAYFGFTLLFFSNRLLQVED